MRVRKKGATLDRHDKQLYEGSSKSIATVFTHNTRDSMLRACTHLVRRLPSCVAAVNHIPKCSKVGLVPLWWVKLREDKVPIGGHGPETSFEVVDREGVCRGGGGGESFGTGFCFSGHGRRRRGSTRSTAFEK